MNRQESLPSWTFPSLSGAGRKQDAHETMAVIHAKRTRKQSPGGQGSTQNSVAGASLTVIWGRDLEEQSLGPWGIGQGLHMQRP